MLALMALRVPIAIAMFIPGAVGYALLASPAVLLNHLKGAAWARLSVYDLSVIPLFLLMGQFATQGGLSRALFRFANSLIGHRQGGMAMAAVLACAAFGTICGSSVATAATVTQVALPEMRRQHYSGRLATGTLAPERGMAWGMGAGLFVFLALYNFARSLKSGSASIVAPIFRLSFTVTALLAVLVLGEPLTLYTLAGLALALAAVWLLLGAESGALPAAGTMRRALVQAVIAMAAMGVANFFYKMGALTGGSPASFITGQAATFLPLATAFAWRVDGGLRTTRAVWTHAGTTAALFLLALVLLFESLARGRASVLVPISQMGFVVTAAFGLAFLREPLGLRKVAGLAFAVAALACLAYS